MTAPSPVLDHLRSEVSRIIAEGVIRKHEIAIRNVEGRLEELNRAAAAGGYVPPGVAPAALIALKAELEGSLFRLQYDTPVWVDA